MGALTSFNVRVRVRMSERLMLSLRVRRDQDWNGRVVVGVRPPWGALAPQTP